MGFWLDSSTGPGSSLDRRHCVVFLKIIGDLIVIAFREVGPSIISHGCFKS